MSNKNMLYFTKKELNDLTKLKTVNTFTQNQIIKINSELEDIHKKTKQEDKRLWAIENDLKALHEDFEILKQQHGHSTFKYFMQKNWWKIGGALIALATIFGAIGDVLYNWTP